MTNPGTSSGRRGKLLMTLFLIFSGGPVLAGSARAEAATSSFTFAASGDLGGDLDTAASLSKLSASGTDFFLAVGDLGYSEISPESAWCDFIKDPKNGKIKPVIIDISSKDVIHSFKVIALRVTQDAMPGLRIPIWFRPTQEGRFQINCAQLCGNGHSTMFGGSLIIESQEAFDKWLASRAGGATSLE